MSDNARISNPTKVLAALSITAAIIVQLTGCGADDTAPTDDRIEGTAAPSPPPTSETIPAAPLGNPCVLQPGVLQDALAPVLGPITVTPEQRVANSADDVCRYLIRGKGGTVDLYSQRYSDGRYLTSGVYDVERDFGGYTPTEVYSSTITAIRDVGGAAGGYDSVAEYPNIAGGMVTDSNNEMVLAGTGEYWFQVLLSGGPYPPAINDAFVQIGNALAAF